MIQYVILKNSEGKYLFCSKIGWNNNQEFHQKFGDNIVHEFEASDYGEASVIFNYYTRQNKINK